MKKTRKIWAVILAVISVCCLIAALIILLREYTDTLRSQSTVDELRATAEATPEPSVTPDTPIPSETPSAESESASEDAEEIPEPTPEPTPTPVVNPYRESFLANRDMAAWIQVPGTKIDYPVMWTPENEEYYLYKDFDGSENKNGCLILDTDSCVNPLTTNLIIHGHNMKSGAMFGTLLKYEDEDYYQEHKSILLYTEECLRNYEIIAVFRSQVYKKSDNVFKFYKFFQADTQEQFDDFYTNIKKLSQYDTGVTAEFGDNFITLSTCTYHVKNGRFVVVAKETDISDSYAPLQ